MKIKFINTEGLSITATIDKEYEVQGTDENGWYIIWHEHDYFQYVDPKWQGTYFETRGQLENQDSLTDNIQTFLREIPQEHHTEVSFLQDGSFHIYMMNNQFTCATEYRLVEVMQALVTLYGKCDE